MIDKELKISLIIFLLVSNSLFCQSPTGSWSDHLVYSTSVDVAVTPDDVFSSTGSSLLVYNKKYSELRKLSRINGLSEVGIAAIDWSETLETLVIVYSSTNIDLLEGTNVYNISDIYRKDMTDSKAVNGVKCFGKYAYVATDFGLVVVDMQKREVYDTWHPALNVDANPVYDVAFINGQVFAATDNGVYYADMNHVGLSYFGNWKLITTLPQPTLRYNAVVSYNARVFVNNPSASGDNVYSISPGDGQSELFYREPDVTFTSFDVSVDGMTFSALSKILFYPAKEGSEVKTFSLYPWRALSAMKAVVYNGDIWIADALSGLVRGKGLTTFSSLTLASPSMSSAEQVISKGGITIVTAGGVSSSWDKLGQKSAISINKGNNWLSATSDSHFDAMRASVDPFDNSKIFVSTYGTGLLEYVLQDKELLFVRDYKSDNSPIEAIANGDTERICGIVFDKSGNLWVTQPQVNGNIKMLKPDGSWIVFPNKINSTKIGDLIITSKGQKWIVLPGGKGLYVFDDNGTPGNFGDDKSKYLTVTDVDGAIFNNVYCVAEDLDGSIWIGTDKGPMIYHNPLRVFDEDIKVTRLKIARNDGTDLADYMLGTEIITSIAVDGGNRKWLGTNSSGAYLLSANGDTQVRHYNEENSPLYSNHVSSVAVNDETGDVWFATSKGVISVRGDATLGKSGFDGIYAFPNPVREDFQGDLTIAGLERDTRVRITDISGNLVYSTVSEGGTAMWNIRTYNGKKVATGVYLIFCASKDGSDAKVIKILVIN